MADIEKAGRIRMYTFTGTPKQRGLAHGEELRSDIADHLELWKEDCRKSTGMKIPDYLNILYRDTNFMPAIEKYAAHLLDEVRGIAEGSGQDFKVVLARQLSDEEPWFRRNLKYLPLLEKLKLSGESIGEHCSALAAECEKDLSPIVAQNMDTPGYYRGYQMLMHIKDPERNLDQMVFTIAGKLSLCGMNSQGVAVCCNTVHQLDYNASGLPEDFVVRKVLEQNSLDEAFSWMKSIPHASGQNYVMGSPQGVLSLECSGNIVSLMKPDPEKRRIAHTNHPIVNPDQGLYRSALEALKGYIDPADEKRISLTTTYRRLEVLQQLLDAVPELTVEKIQGILADRTAPLCVSEKTHYTLGSLIMELDADNPRMHIAQDLPAGGEFYTVSMH